MVREMMLTRPWGLVSKGSLGVGGGSEGGNRCDPSFTGSGPQASSTGSAGGLVRPGEPRVPPQPSCRETGI